MTIEITVEERMDNEVVRASRMLTDTEIDYAGYDIIGQTVNQLRREITDRVRKYGDTQPVIFTRSVPNG